MAMQSGVIRMLVLGLLFSQAACEFVPRDAASLRGSGRLYFVTVGEFSGALVESLSSHYKRKYNLDIDVLPGLAWDSRSMDLQRNQVIAEESIRLVRQAYPEVANDPNAVVIALTSNDMFISKKQWRFAFSYRENDRFAVVSSGRMHLGLSADQFRVFESRLRKMVTKNIGVLYYHLPMSFHEKSVMYMGVGGIEELDTMGEDY